MKTSTSSLYVGIASFGLTLTFLLSGVAEGAPGAGTYVGAGSVVVSENTGSGLPPTLLDNGAVVCHDANGDGSPESGEGGLCIPFADLNGDGILVKDESLGLRVAFQVCIDNNGDGVCGGNGQEGFSEPCGDAIFFSHESRTNGFHNPLWVPLQGFNPGCDVGQFPGYIVIVCAGAHQTHSHQVTQGTITSVPSGTGFGDFCGAPTAAKAYTIV